MGRNPLRRVDSRGGTRTPDPVINSHLLYQLSYSGKDRQGEISDLPLDIKRPRRSYVSTDSPGCCTGGRQHRTAAIRSDGMNGFRRNRLS